MNGSNITYNCTPFFHSLLTKGKFMEFLRKATSREMEDLQYDVRTTATIPTTGISCLIPNAL